MSDLDASREAGLRLRAEIERHLGPDRPVRSLRQLAEKAGVQATTISQWWTKGAVPDTATLAKVAIALDAPLAPFVNALGGVTPETDVGRVLTLSPEQLEDLLTRAARRAVEMVAEDRRREGHDE